MARQRGTFAGGALQTPQEPSRAPIFAEYPHGFARAAPQFDARPVPSSMRDPGSFRVKGRGIERASSAGVLGVIAVSSSF